MTKRVAIADKAASILEVLSRSQKPMTAYDLLDQLRGHGITSPPTIYRALGRLLDAGKIHRLETLTTIDMKPYRSALRSVTRAARSTSSAMRC